MTDIYNIQAIREILGRHGFHFTKSKGQNFLTDGRIPERIAEAAGLTRDTGVLEIGPGMGALTRPLCERAGHVTAIELDGRLLPILDETMAGYHNLTVVHGDVLKEDLGKLADERLLPIVCANLPYHITTPALTALLSCRRFSRIVVMVQKEVAQRICAGPGTPEYGAFTVFCRHYAEAKTLFRVPASAFTPQPKVESAVVMFTPNTLPPDRSDVLRFSRAAFGQRRKTLVNALAAGLSLPKDKIASCLAKLGHGPNVRGETLSYEQFVILANTLGEEFHV
jgi:16S rRNA (adenine1518-N6/adenine1519-N6)-dimethyltransferase